MSYGRTLKVVVNGNTIAEQTSVDEDALNVKFEVKQTTLQSPNNATIRINNVSKSTAQSIPDGVTSHGRVELTCGYQDEPGALVYSGDIKQRRIGKETVVTTYVEILSSDGSVAYNAAYVNKSFAKGSTQKDHFMAALQAMQDKGNVSLGYVTQGLLDSFKYPRGVAFFSMARDVLRTIGQSSGANWSIQNGKLQMVKHDDATPGVIVVNETCGMIGMPVETPNGIVVRTLLDGRMQPNGLIQMNEADIQRGAISLGNDQEITRSAYDSLGTAEGVYKILSIDRIGELRGRDWYNDIVCIGKSAQSNAQTKYLTPGAGG